MAVGEDVSRRLRIWEWLVRVWGNGCCEEDMVPVAEVVLLQLSRVVDGMGEWGR